MTLSITWGMAQFFQQEKNSSERPFAKFALVQVAAVSSVLKLAGEQAAKQLVQEIRGKSALKIIILDEQNNELMLQSSSSASSKNAREQAEEHNIIAPFIKRIVNSPSDHRYKVMAWLPDRHGAFMSLKHSTPFGLFKPFQHAPRRILIRLSIALLISGTVCFWLAWYLASPVRRLREANRRLSMGELSVRIGNTMGKRRDEIADLAHDFDRMAEQLQTLILTQKQLLNDVSHELRSPLARLQVALALARKKTGKQAEKDLNRIEQEVNRLDELIGQVLTLARLEVLEPDILGDYVDIINLLETIIKDAEFEAENCNRHVHLVSETSWTLKANNELLRRALENIIRNAVHHTLENTIVEVNVQQSIKADEYINISICDHGPGVPEKKLPILFEPFVRLCEARERSSGGYGLGLAIAERAIRLHGGKVDACNRDTGGLCIQIHLPLNNEGSGSESK